MSYKYLFGPVISRRLGISLGVDIVPFKTCTHDCIYCECGATTVRTDVRKPYISSEDIIRELDELLSTSPELDYITFSGGGEPTLNSEIGKIINYIKTSFPEYKIALLTNSYFLKDKSIIDEISKCDLIIPSLDAVSPELIERINCIKIKENDILNIIHSIKELKEKCSGELWLEIFIVPEINDAEEELSKLKTAVDLINPTKIQLNTIDRPSTKKGIMKADKSRLKHIRDYFSEFNVEIIDDRSNLNEIDESVFNIESEILSLIKRRPCTVEELAKIFSKDRKEIEKYLHAEKNSDRILKLNQNNNTFYKFKD